MLHCKDNDTFKDKDIKNDKDFCKDNDNFRLNWFSFWAPTDKPIYKDKDKGICKDKDKTIYKDKDRGICKDKDNDKDKSIFWLNCLPNLISLLKRLST